MVMVVVVWGFDRCNAGMNRTRFIARAKAGRRRHPQFIARANAEPPADPAPAEDLVAGPSADPISTKNLELVKQSNHLLLISTHALRTT